MNVYVGIDIGSRSDIMSCRQNGLTAGVWTIVKTAKDHETVAKSCVASSLHLSFLSVRYLPSGYR